MARRAGDRAPASERLRLRLLLGAVALLGCGGGVTLCIDTTLHLIASMLGAEVARETARILEYDRAQRANRDGFAPIVTLR